MFRILENSFQGLVNLTEKELSLISSKFKYLKSHKGNILLHKGETPKYLYFVNKGYLRIFCTQKNGKEYTRFIAFEGSFGTAFPGFIKQQPSLAFIDTLEPTDLLAIHYNDFQLLLNEIPSFEKFYRFSLEKNYVESVLRIEKLITLGAKERYLSIMKEEPHLIQRLPNRILANYLGISQETLSRLKTNL